MRTHLQATGLLFHELPKLVEDYYEVTSQFSATLTSPIVEALVAPPDGSSETTVQLWTTAGEIVVHYSSQRPTLYGLPD